MATESLHDLWEAMDAVSNAGRGGYLSAAEEEALQRQLVGVWVQDCLSDLLRDTFSTGRRKRSREKRHR